MASGRDICNFKACIPKEKLGYLAALWYDGVINPIRQELITMDKHFTYQTQGVCASQISFDMIDGHVFNVNFKGGCRGNTQGVAILADGLEARAAIKRLRGVECHGGTSCPDQLAIAIAACLESMGETV